MRPFQLYSDRTAATDKMKGRQVPVCALCVDQFGATFGQSLGDHLVLASTLKLVGRDGWRWRFRQRRDRSSRGRSRVSMETDRSRPGRDGDVRGMRVGVSVKNLREPEFGDGETSGSSWSGRRGRALRSCRSAGRSRSRCAAVDADLTTTPTAFGDARHLARGAEAWLFERAVGVRGGVSANTVGRDRGASAAVRAMRGVLRRRVRGCSARRRGDGRGAKGWGFRVSE